MFVRGRAQELTVVGRRIMENMPIAGGSASTLRISFVSRRNCLLVIVFLLVAVAPPAVPQSKAKNVLILSGGRGRDSINLMESSLRAHFSDPVNFSVVDLDNMPRFGLKSYQGNLAETLRAGFAGEKLDLVITVMPRSLEFAVQYRDKLFPGIPIVFMSISSRLPEKMWPGVTGVVSLMGVPEMIDLALHLHPDTQAVAIIGEVSGPSGIDNEWFLAEHAELLRYRNRVSEIDLLGPVSPDLLEKVAELPPHTVVLFQLYPHDADQPAFGAFDVLAAVAQRFPTYSILPHITLGRGGVGAAGYDPPTDAILVGELAARVLSGERPDKIPVVQNAKINVSVDWRQLRRWNIPESALPPGTLVLYREPSLWDRGKKYFLAAITVFVIQTFLILGLFWQRARKRKAEAVLRESEKRFRVMVDSTPSLVWMCDAEGKVSYLNEERIAFTGSEPGVGYGDAFTAYVHPDDLKDVLDVFSNGLKNHERFSMEYRLRRQDGMYRWMFDVVAPRVNGDGSFAGFIGSAADVTDQKMAREALETVSGQLIAAQEKERSHLARELHDDICQRLAMLSLRIERVTKGWGSVQKPVSEQLEEIWQQCSTLTGDVQALSHELHPSILDNLGLVTGVKSFCREFSQQHEAVVDFTDRNIPPSLPRDVSLSLFRVIQEALHNAVKYSGQKHFKVHLKGSTDRIELEVSDQGAGFDVDSMKNGRGLGLVSMSERIHLLNGSITIDSKPNAGTTIRASVPLAAQTKVLAASAS